MHYFSAPPPLTKLPRLVLSKLQLTILSQRKKSQQLYWLNHPMSPVDKNLKEEKYHQTTSNNYTFLGSFYHPNDLRVDWTASMYIMIISYLYIYNLQTTSKSFGVGLSIKLYLWVFTTIYTPPSFTAAPPFPPTSSRGSPFTLPTLVVSKMPGLSRNSFTSLSWRPLEIHTGPLRFQDMSCPPPKKSHGTLKIQAIEKENTSKNQTSIFLSSWT